MMRQPVHPENRCLTFENTTNLSKALGYIDQTDFKVHINPNLWRNKDGYANGP